ncbi:hypothetical protein [Lacticaseibacillus hulanensis]|uniref:hypothetical protein n=1 Tax=Lacticaseibacillus hulanensis TaxID=2493111 RepID=UPI000FDC1BDD|nr:hypothetical protein [Lacticaseibacillus hulanensis]
MANEQATMPKLEPRYSKAELLGASNLTGRERDVLAAALRSDKTYTTDEAKLAIQKFKGGMF